MTDLLRSPDIRVPLRNWIRNDAKRHMLEQLAKGPDQMIRLKKQSTLRKATVGYGIVRLLRHARSMKVITDPVKECSTDNFVVSISRHVQELPWNDVVEVSMISPSLSVQLNEPSFLANIVYENARDRMGRYLEVSITVPASSIPSRLQAKHSASAGLLKTIDDSDCHLLGIVLYELFSGLPPFPSPAEPLDKNGATKPAHCKSQKTPDRKRSTVRYDKKKGKSYSTLQRKPYAPLQELGLPSSICLLVEALIDGDKAYSSLEDASSDIHLLLSDPDCFLFDLGGTFAQNGNMQLRTKKGKLYGREKEVSLVTDAFCRVSSGRNEAIFIKGYSGVGKTCLVQSLTARVDVFGGYVLTQKVDQMSKEKPLLDVLSAFNRLCALIKSKTSPLELLAITNKIMVDFESDFSVLARLLPNISLLFPQLAKPAARDASVEQIMNLHGVSYILQRFMRIVSSRLRPVMLFMDDLQWAGSTSLELIQTLLSNTRGLACFFFVGSYRSNEVDQGHPIYDLVEHLNSSGVRSTQLHLCGLSRDDLNLMISESLCIFPRICKSLSDCVHSKTKGNPFFALEFLGSLLDSAVLKYSLRERRWIWDMNKIEAENITDNVLHLLSAKMTSFSESVQSTLKILSCFGTEAELSVAEYLSSTPQYPHFWDWLNQAIKEGCIQKVGSAITFAHDKVREAAYGLIPDDEKTQFHYNLGLVLYSVSRGKDPAGDAILYLIDQINHGIPELIQPHMRIDVIELNFDSGSIAMDRSDYETALSYFSNAFSLLPENHWSSNYEFCLQLYFLSAKAAYSCGNIEKAHRLLKAIIEAGRCFRDKLDAYYLYATILHACQESDEAYTTCCEVLSQLNEAIPDSFDVQRLLKKTGDLLRRMSDDDLLNLKEMDSALVYTMKFYTLLKCICFWKKPELMPFLGCRMILISLEHGVCVHSVFGLVQYSAMLCQSCKLALDIREACRIGKVAMAMLKRFEGSSEIMPSVNFCYYGFVSVHVLPLQVCTDNLRKGFEVGMSAGDSTTMAFYNSIHLVRTALHSGENLSALLSETDFHLEAIMRLRNKLALPYLTSYRELFSTLIDKGESTSPAKSYDDLEEKISSNALYANRHKETLFVNRTLQAFWLGYSQRCHHCAKKSLEMKILGRHNKLMILWYAALNAFRGVKNTNGNGSQFVKVRSLYKDAATALRSAKELSPWNFGNKCYLLEAEMHSFEKNWEEAKSSYAAAISSSGSSRYVQEQGLACELAGLHYKKIGEKQTALNSFRRAKECYAQWGSQMKIESINQQIDRLHCSSE